MEIYYKIKKRRIYTDRKLLHKCNEASLHNYLIDTEMKNHLMPRYFLIIGQALLFFLLE